MKLFNRNFILLWQGQFISQLGFFAFTIAATLWIKHTTSSIALVGIWLLLSRSPVLFFGPFGGVLADRYSRVSIIVVCDLLSGISTLLLFVFMFMTTANTTIMLYLLLTVSLLIAIVDCFFRPAVSALIPDIVPRNKVVMANSINSGSIQFSRIIGQCIAGVAFRLLGAPVLFLINALTYIYSAVSEMFINAPRYKKDTQYNSTLTFGILCKNLLEGLRYVKNDRGLFAVLIELSTFAFFMLPFITLMPFYIEDILKVSSDWYGYSMGAFGFGSIIGCLCAAKINCPGDLRSNLLRFSFIIDFIALIILVIFPTLFVLVVEITIFGLTQGYVFIHFTSAVQLATPTEIRGRVIGLFETVIFGMSPIAMALAGVAAEVIGKQILPVILTCGIVGLTISTIMVFNRDLKSFLAYTHTL
jgi:MFS family permease